MYLCIYVSICNLQAWKQSNSARLLQLLHLIASKRKQFCETSSNFEVGNIKNEAILRDFLHVWTWQHQKRKSDKVLRRSRKIIFANLKIWCSKMQPLSGNQQPDLLTSLMNIEHVSCTAPATRNPSLQIFFKCPMPAIVFENVTKPSCFAHFWQGGEYLAPATQNDASTSKSGANMWCFVHFDFEMCFAPQRRTLFEHLNFQKCSEAEVFCFAAQRHTLSEHFNLQKCSEAGVFCTFWLRHVLCATTACTFSTSQLPKVLRGWGVLYILTTACTFSTTQLPKVVRPWCVLSILIWKCVSHYNRVQLFISHLARWLRARRFSEPTFRPSGATNHWKNTVFRDFPTFSRTWIFFLLRLSLFWSSFFFSSLLLFSLLFSSLLLPGSSHLCFSSVHIVGSLTSKLP